MSDCTETHVEGGKFWGFGSDRRGHFWWRSAIGFISCHVSWIVEADWNCNHWDYSNVFRDSWIGSIINGCRDDCNVCFFRSRNNWPQQWIIKTLIKRFIFKFLTLISVGNWCIQVLSGRIIWAVFRNLLGLISFHNWFFNAIGRSLVKYDGDIWKWKGLISFKNWHSDVIWNEIHEISSSIGLFIISWHFSLILLRSRLSSSGLLRLFNLWSIDLKWIISRNCCINHSGRLRRNLRLRRWTRRCFRHCCVCNRFRLCIVVCDYSGICFRRISDIGLWWCHRSDRSLRFGGCALN